MITININLVGEKGSEKIKLPVDVDADMLGLVGVGAAGFIVALLIPFFFNFIVDGVLLARAARESERLKGVLGKSSGEMAKIGEYRTHLRALEGEYNLLKTLVGQGAIWPSILEELRTLIPTDMWVTNVAIGGNTLRITARALNYKAVAYFYTNLQNAKNFASPVLGPISSKGGAVTNEKGQVAVGNQTSIDFNVTCQVLSLQGTSMKKSAATTEEGSQ
ncbi:MAG TPA: PilN domain-containing protein [Chroococcales cyanobacterium]|jgi:Tfp pilus assembly protein PilN